MSLAAIHQLRAEIRGKSTGRAVALAAWVLLVGLLALAVRIAVATTTLAAEVLTVAGVLVFTVAGELATRADVALARRAGYTPFSHLLRPAGGGAR